MDGAVDMLTLIADAILRPLIADAEVSSFGVQMEFVFESSFLA